MPRTDLVVCPACDAAAHANCEVQALDADDQWVPCACACGGGTEAWREQ